MLDALWPTDQPGHRCIVGIKDGVVKHFWTHAPEQVMAAADKLDAAGWDVYFAPATYEAQQRKAAQAVYIPALWLDIDCGPGKDYPDKRQGLAALTAWMREHDIPKPSYIVSSGNGLHIYWRLTEPRRREDWLVVAQHLKQATALHGLRADPMRTADAASILRVPGTHNRKDPEHPQQVQVLADTGETVSLNDFRAALPAVGPIRAVPSQRNDEWAVPTNLPPGDAEQIATRCQQMRELREKRGAVSEPFWRAGLSVLKRCTDANQYIHAWSQGDPRYDAEQTQAKADATAGPATCAHFVEVNPGGCFGCPFAGKVASPIMLGVGEEKPAEGAKPAFAPVQVPGFKCVADGVWFDTGEDEVPPSRLTEIPIWIEEVRSRARLPGERGHSSLLIYWQDMHGSRRSALLDQEELWEPRLFTRWLAAHNLMPFVWDKGKLMTYIGRLTAEVYRKEGERTSYDRLGWYGDTDMFVLGPKAVTAKGIQNVVVESSNSISQLKIKGSRDAWAKAANLLGKKPEYAPYAFTLLASLAAPLLELANRDGAVVALAGESGRGKTLAARFGLSAFVSPDEVMESGQSTVNAIEVRMGSSRHVPVLIDEVTNMPIKRLADIIYMAANGVGKSSLTRNRQNRPRHTWRTVTILTSNHSLMDRAQNEIEEAHRRRLLEIPANDTMDPADAQALVDAIRQNPGSAAEDYLRTVLRFKDKIPQLFNLVQQHVERWSEAEQANRFVTWTLSGALLAGILARLAGLIDWNPVDVVRSIIGETKETYENIIPPEQRAHDSLMEFLTANSKHVCKWAEGTVGMLVDDPIARIDGGRLYVHGSRLNEYWAEQHVNKAAIRPWLKQVVLGRRKRRLAPGTMPISAYEFDMEQLGVADDDLVKEE